MASDHYNLTPDAPRCAHRYFTSRPDLLTRGGLTSASEGAETQSSIPAAPAAAAAFTAAQRALANPATSRAFAAGIQRAGNAVSGNTSSTASPPPVPPSRSASSAAVDNDSAPAISYGRVAAAAQAFSAAAPTPPPPRAANPPTHKHTDSSTGLIPQKVRKMPPQCVPSVLPYQKKLFSGSSFTDPRRYCDRNLETWTCRPREPCSARCVGRRPQRTHRQRRYTRPLRLWLRKPSRHPPCAASLHRPLHPCQSQSRNRNRRRQKRKRLGSG